MQGLFGASQLSVTALLGQEEIPCWKYRREDFWTFSKTLERSYNYNQDGNWLSLLVVVTTLYSCALDEVY